MVRHFNAQFPSPERGSACNITLRMARISRTRRCDAIIKRDDILYCGGLIFEEGLMKIEFMAIDLRFPFI